MTFTAPPQILLTGATGYIGGSILTHLLSSPALSSTTITCLVRGQDRADTLSSTYGTRVKTALHRDLDDTETSTAVAAQHDIVINTTLGYHPTSAQALIRGLAQRKASTGRDVWMIHTSGTSNLADQSISGTYVEKVPNPEFDDAKDDIYGYEQQREALDPYPQRTTELGVIDAGLDLGVKTLVIMSPLIYGIGNGLFNKISVQIPAYITSILTHQRAAVVAEGKGVWGYVHVEDLAELYKIAVVDVLENAGKNLPVGKKGIIFSDNGRFTWREVVQGVVDVLHEQGKVPDRQVESVSLAEGAKLMNVLGMQDEKIVELGLSSNSRTVSTVGRKLGWKPTRGAEAWKQGFRDDVDAVLAKK